MAAGDTAPDGAGSRVDEIEPEGEAEDEATLDDVAGGNVVKGDAVKGGRPEQASATTAAKPNAMPMSGVGRPAMGSD